VSVDTWRLFAGSSENYELWLFHLIEAVYRTKRRTEDD
jgi:hypothetical protein